MEIEEIIKSSDIENEFNNEINCGDDFKKQDDQDTLNLKIIRIKGSMQRSQEKLNRKVEILNEVSALYEELQCIKNKKNMIELRIKNLVKESKSIGPCEPFNPDDYL